MINDINIRYIIDFRKFHFDFNILVLRYTFEL